MFIGPMHHANIVTRNMEESLAFWRDMLGWKVLSDVEISGSKAARLVGVPDARFRAVMLQPAEKIYAGMIELVEFLSPKGKPSVIDEKMNDIGIRMLSFLVSDCEQVYAELKKKGCRFLSPPHQTDMAGWFFKACIFSDPVDNCKIEIIEFLRSPEEAKK